MLRCSICKRRNAFYVRRYSGERLCRRCFSESIENKVRATISKYDLFKFDDKIAVAVSGGKDSVNLLHILSKIEADYPESSICAITVDEGIRGYRDEAIKIAAENCEMLRIDQIVVSFKELFGYTLDEIVEKTKNRALTPCAYCGVLRRRALNIAARKVGVDKIATAHTLDDEIQTFLLNLFHGDPFRIVRSGPKFISENPQFTPRVKPFCEVLERESVLYAYVKGIRFQEMPCPYAGEALRNDMRIYLNRLEERHPGIKYTFFRSIERIRESLATQIEEVRLRSCRICGEPTTGDICQVCKILIELES
ncbi:TIGR00269 family protein [Candidatus Bathyarchaeota archaeon]|nr:MAG: TIGR00269 family protein [Candidatus Bathyarchaeota archaeon]